MHTTKQTQQQAAFPVVESTGGKGVKNNNSDFIAWVAWWCRLRLRAERSIPLGFDQRLQAYLCGKGGAIIGDLPPYEAFPIGGTASVRGYGEGSVGSGRNYVAGTAELHFPLVAPFEVCVCMHPNATQYMQNVMLNFAIGSSAAEADR